MSIVLGCIQNKTTVKISSLIVCVSTGISLLLNRSFRPSDLEKMDSGFKLDCLTGEELLDEQGDEDDPDEIHPVNPALEVQREEDFVKYEEITIKDEPITDRVRVTTQPIRGQDDNATYSFACGVCGRTFNTFSSMKRHENFFHLGPEEMFISCRPCRKSFQSEHHFKRHSEDVHYDRDKMLLSCLLCRRSFHSLRKFNNHVHGLRKDRYKCEVCGKAFSQLYHRNRHRSTVHAPRVPTECRVCGKVFQSPHLVERHVESSHPDGPITCKQCEKVFTTRWQLRDHVERTHEARESVCEQCELVFANAICLRNHVKAVHDTRVVPCIICGKSIKQVSLKGHLATVHSSERPFECDICGQKFKRQQGLKCHIDRSHVTVKISFVKSTAKAAAVGRATSRKRKAKTPSYDMSDDSDG